MLIHSASQVLTISGGPQVHPNFGHLGIIRDGAVLIQGESIGAVGATDALLKKYPQEPRIDARGMVVMPGLVDPHTHLVWAGDRAAEFEQRLEGKSYMEILSAGGGINATVQATRCADFDTLYQQTRQHADACFITGTTTLEAKTGYGLQIDQEIKQLSVLAVLADRHPLEICPTFLGAHAIPPEFSNDPSAYAREVADHMLPQVKRWWTQEFPEKSLPFVDVFCEEGAFDIHQSRRILGQAKKLGFPLKIHADEFKNIGGAALAAHMGAVSADHLVKTSAADMSALAQAGTVAVSLPCTPFGLAEREYTPAREMIKAGCVLALASDLNPGTAWCGNMQFAIALACRSMRLTPAEAIAAATINAAAAVQMDKQIGAIEAGKQADILILNVNDYRHVAYRFGNNMVGAIIKKGKQDLPPWQSQ